MCNFSGIENEHEILSSAQLEAQQELSIIDEPTALKNSAAEITDIKVIKRDNIVLGISDLKQKIDAKPAIGAIKSATRTVIVGASNVKKKIGDNLAGQIAINPINTIKVNNCEIVNRLPRSVTAAIFSLPPFSAKTEQQKSSANTAAVNKVRGKSSTAKIFRPNPQNATSVTSSIFAPRTKDMNKGFLMFSEDESGLTSKYSNVRLDY